MSRTAIEPLEDRRLFAGVFQESGGIAVAEIESHASSQWTKKTSPSGYTGSGAYQWNGSQYFGTPGVATLVYDFKINNPGVYNLKLRSFNPTSDSTEHNDVWIRIDGGKWYKTFTHEKQKWTWVTTRELSHGNFDKWRPNFSVGNHRIEISARSSLYTLDRVVLHKDNVNGENASIPQSPTSGSPNPDPGADALKVTSLSLINADTDQPIAGHETITASRTIDLASLPTRNLSIRANTNDGVRSVKFQVTGLSTKVENIKPFALLGDNNGDYNAWTPSAGNYAVTLTGYSATGASGTAGAPLSLSLNLTNSGSSNTDLAVTSLSLINADTNEVISGYSNFSSDRTIALSTLPTRNLSIRANTAAGVKSVRMVLDGVSRIESIKPFALFGDNNGDYNAWRPTARTYTLAVTGYSQTGATGTAGQTISLALRFT
jgi:hypothetical protein